VIFPVAIICTWLYSLTMRSKVAERCRRDDIADVVGRTPSERIAMVRRARERGIALYVAGQRVDREVAVRAIRRERQTGRRYSRCMIESL
jgi:hypothetical protein